MNRESSVMYRARTSDGIAVLFWDDGAITDLAGHYPPGIGRVRGETLKLHGGVCALVAEVCPEYLYQRLPEMIRAARQMMARPLPVYPQDIRDVLAGKPDPTKPRKQPAKALRCTACRYTVAGWQLCAHHWMQNQRR